MELTSKQRAQLRGLANGIDTIVHIGKDGITDNLVKQAGDALEAQGRDCHNHGLALLPLPKRIFSHYTTKIRAAHLRKSPKKAPLFEPIGEKEKIPPIGANIAFTAGEIRAIVVDV